MAFALPADLLTLTFVSGYLLAAALGVGIAFYLVRNHWDRPASRAFGLLAAILGLWSMGMVLRVLSTSMATKQVVHVAMYACIYATPLLFLVFAVRYSGYDRWLSSRSVGSLAVVPAVGWLALLTNPTHHLFYERVWLDASTGTPVLASEVAAPFWVFAGYNWLLFLVGSVLLAHAALDAHPRYRPSAGVLLVGVAIPLAANVGYLLGVKPHPHLDPTPVFLAIGSLPIAYVVSRSGMLDLLPVARNRVLEAAGSGFVVVDDRQRVADLDETALMAVAPGASVDDVVGAPADRALPSELWEAVEAGRTAVEWERPAAGDGTSRHYLVRNRPLTSGAAAANGRVLTVVDITTQEGRREELEAKTERLDEFAAVLSHDLRNPLGVAKGYLELARDDVDSDQLEAAAEALERIERLVDSTLEYAKLGLNGEASPVELEVVAERSWESISGSEATLRVDGSARFLANPDVLPQLFENLLGNAVEHGGQGVTVTVGTVGDDGFFVEDDGPGIPPDRREAVFERGFSTAGTGAGFGLAIVAQIAEAHGWAVDLTESSAGGARFEFTGVEVVEPSDESA